MPLLSACSSCGSSSMSPFFSLKRIPINSMVLLPDRKEALEYPKGDMDLAFCQCCGFISNLAFDPELIDYTQNYESSQAFSPRFNAYAEGLATRLIDRYNLRGKDIVEIGCGGGEFLELICQLGGSRGVGIDPVAGLGREVQPGRSPVSFVRDFYSEDHSGYPADIILCRHTLEHLWNPGDFLDTVRRSLGDRRQTAIFFELPDVTRILREVAFLDIYYEHCSYFSAGSLAQIFTAKGFDVTEVNLAFDDQYLWLEAFPGNAKSGNAKTAPQCGNEDYLQGLSQEVAHFAETCTQQIQVWAEKVHQAASRGKRCIVWGGGSKGVAFLNTLGILDEVEYVVDINPMKQSMYVPGTGHEIVGPEFLANHKPDVILVMNPIYCDEIGSLVRGMGIDAQLVAF